MKIRLPREDGAWWMALMCWVAGWAAALRPAWEPLAMAAGVVGLLAAAAALRAWRRTRAPWTLALAAAEMLPAGGLAALLAWRAPEPEWLLALGIPAAAYAPFVVAGAERRPFARLLAVVALTAIAPGTYALAAGTFGAVAGLLWASLAGYFAMGSVFIMARLRRSTAALWVARILPLAAAAAAAPVHWILAAIFVVLAARAWAFRFDGPIDPRRVGKTELAYGALSAAFVLLSLWMR